MWIGSAKNNETKPLGFKSLGINLSYKHKDNDNLNFFIKMDTKLNIWQTRDLPWSMLRVPEMVIKLGTRKNNKIFVEKRK